jgi:hypothetical protein
MLDCYLVIAICELCLQRSSQGESFGPKTPLVIGTILLVRAFAVLRVVAPADGVPLGLLSLLAFCRLDRVSCQTRTSQLAVSAVVAI